MPDFATSLPALLQSFDARIRQEAERLADDDAIRGLDIVEDEVLAEVVLDDRRVNVRWALEDGQWQGESDCDEAPLHDLALCAALIASQRRFARQAPAAGAPSLPPEETFQIMLERRLARQLTPEEEGYLSKLEKRFQRVRQSGQIYDQDMVRLHPRWSIQSMDPLALWPEPPVNLKEFWEYVALALQEKNLPAPAFLRNSVDLDAVRERLGAWRQERTLPLWRERIRTLLRALHDTPPKPRQYCDFRLVITTAEARLQIKESDTAFRNVSGAELHTLENAHERGALNMPAAAELLLMACINQTGANPGEVCRFDLDNHSRWLGTLFQQPALQARMLTLDEAPFRRVSEPLQWSSQEEKETGQLLLSLVQADGTPAPLPLRIMHGAETQYLSADTVFPGPVWFAEETRLDSATAIPINALATQDGITFLDKLRLPLPADIAARIKHEPLKVQVKAGCLARSHASSTEHAVFQVEAVTPDGVVREVLRYAGWQPTENARPDDDNSIICRDRTALAEAENALHEMRPVYDPEHEGFRVRLTKTFPEQFNNWAQGLPSSMSLQADERLQSILADPLIARVRIEASQTANIDWFDLKMVFEVEGADLKAADIRRLIAAKGGFVQLADGTWRRVKLELTEEQQAMMDQLGLDLDEFSNEAHRLHWRQLTGQGAKEIINPRAWQNLTQRMEQAKLDERPAVPEGLGVTLRPYQEDGYHFLAYLSLNKFGGILADDMGLGKTIQSITWILWLRTRYRTAWPCLVVCPKSVLDVWATEFGKAAPGLKVQVLRDKEELDLESLYRDSHVLVMNYAQLRGCIELLESVKWLAVILDEGQHIKNPDSKAAKAARMLKAENRLVLSGTPVENRLLDLWSLMTFAAPGALGDRNYFTRHFDRRKDARASERLSARLKPFLLRRTKSQVAKELPARSEEAMLCEMTGTQERLYREELAKAQHMVLTASGFEVLTRKRFAILQALTRLRQICCHPGLVDKSSGDEDSAKLASTLEMIEGLHAEGHKVLLFSQFVTMLNIIRDKLDEMNIPHYWLTGSTNNRSEVVQQFQEDPDPCVFLLSLKAGGSGLNLTSASYVILYDPWWNPAVEAQAIDRAHRIGQTQPVMAYRMITKGTIEEKIMLLQQKKSLMSANILGEGGFSSTLEKSDFEFLFGLEAEEAMNAED
ncbi:Helicase conserved C-terminal domain-containing protein [Prosthecobacter debontii]|uniref:Helicase conserved C-terminal domain-containing protein n=1 Tax=Prosthecobacter debontii TaxID=48467 RepID=A0A1T4XY84_9BACT|nr:DEAD/DEAH box helicase [Prosthecobacter debontii]SKA94178.1 Helicase conserved C-terminal domain-containing protein [Prosthecobacter debontii]